MRASQRRAVVGLIGIALVAAGAAPASAAAGPRASCVGTIASSLAPGGGLDMGEFKAVARAQGVSNFGQFVAGGAQQRFGDLDPCLRGEP